jgi:hypothetical protein
MRVNGTGSSQANALELREIYARLRNNPNYGLAQTFNHRLRAFLSPGGLEVLQSELALRGEQPDRYLGAPQVNPDYKLAQTFINHN